MARTKAHREWAARNAEQIKQWQHDYRQRAEVKAARRQKDTEDRNARNSKLGWMWHRFKEMQHRRLTTDYRELSIVNPANLQRPVFIVVHRGVRRRETLFDPLPTWEES